MTVPAVVPSLFHSSMPWRRRGGEVERAARGRPVRREGVGGPGTDVLHHDGPRPVPVALPQLAAVGSVVGLEEQDARDVGEIEPGYGPAAKFLTKTVPASVPSLRQSPCLSSTWAANGTVPSTSVARLITEPAGPATMSFTRLTVGAAEVEGSAWAGPRGEMLRGHKSCDGLMSHHQVRPAFVPAVSETVDSRGGFGQWTGGS